MRSKGEESGRAEWTWYGICRKRRKKARLRGGADRGKLAALPFLFASLRVQIAVILLVPRLSLSHTYEGPSTFRKIWRRLLRGNYETREGQLAPATEVETQEDGSESTTDEWQVFALVNCPCPGAALTARRGRRQAGEPEEGKRRPPRSAGERHSSSSGASVYLPKVQRHPPHTEGSRTLHDVASSSLKEEKLPHDVTPTPNTHTTHKTKKIFLLHSGTGARKGGKAVSKKKKQQVKRKSSRKSQNKRKENLNFKGRVTEDEIKKGERSNQIGGGGKEMVRKERERHGWCNTNQIDKLKRCDENLTKLKLLNLKGENETI